MALHGGGHLELKKMHKGDFWGIFGIRLGSCPCIIPEKISFLQFYSRFNPNALALLAISNIWITTPSWIKCQIPQYFWGRKLNCIPHITYIIEWSIEIITSVANYIQQGLGWWQDNPTKGVLVISQTQTRLRLYCAWIGETIVSGRIGSDRQPRFEIIIGI